MSSIIGINSITPKQTISAKNPAKLNFQLQKKCLFCYGSGYTRPFIICDKCHGTGLVPLIEPHIY